MHFKLHKAVWLLYAPTVNKHKHNYIMTVTDVGIKWDYFEKIILLMDSFFPFSLSLYKSTVLYDKATSICLSLYHHLPMPNVYIFV